MKKNLLGLFIIILLLFMPKIVYAADKTAEKIHFISSSNGDSMIIESNGRYGLVDALDESSAANVKTYAQAIGVQHFDFVIMTHNHADNIGGIPTLTTLFDSNTIVFYKEDLISYDTNNEIDDYEETQGYLNHQTNALALQAFANANSKTCDVTKASQLTNASCTLSTLTNTAISGVSYNSNSADETLTNVKEYLSFDFGDFNIKLYSLYNLAYHHENLNSIVTLITNKNTEATAVLTGDLETTNSDADYPENAGRSNIIANPTFVPDLEDPSATCRECTSFGIENQIALIIQDVTLLKAANHGKNLSNSLASLTIYKPAYYITSGALTGSDYTSNIAAITFLKNGNGTEVYSPSQAERALVAEFNDNTTDIVMKSYNATGGNITTVNDYGDDPFEDGWKTANISNKDDIAYFYVENGAPAVDEWKDIEKNSITNRYRFDTDGTMITGFYEDDKNDDDETNDEVYYLCEEASCLGEMQTGFQNINYVLLDESTVSYKFYFRPDADATGNKGEMVTGLTTIGGDTYYFRTTKDEAFEGPRGSALINGCVEIESQNTCFDSNGILTTNVVPTPKPTDALCINPEYTGTQIEITSAPKGGYTWSNNEQTNVGDYQVTATLNAGYIWSDNTTDPVQINCSITKAILDKPELLEESYMYTGSVIRPEFASYNNEEGASNPGLVVTGTSSATSSGNYTMTISLANTTDYEWEDGTTDPITFSWGITTERRPEPTVAPYTGEYTGQPQHVSVVVNGEGTPQYSLDDENWSDEVITRTDIGTTVLYVRTKGDADHVASNSVQTSITITRKALTKPNLTTDTFPYTGSSKTPVFDANYDSTVMTLSGDTSATNAGNYSVTIALNDTERYVWNDASESSYVLVWSITKATKQAPSVTGYNKEYDGNAHTVTATAPSAGDVLEYSEDGTSWSTTAPTRTDVGETTVYVRVQGDNNYEPSGAINGSIIVTPKVTTIPVLTSQTFSYTGSEKTPVFEEYDPEIMTMSGTTSATNVGNYPIEINLKNTTNYKWSDDTTTSQDFVWEITKSKKPVPTVEGYTGTYDGSEHTITITGTGTMKYSTDGTSWGDVLPSLQNAGTLVIYVKALGDDNYDDSDVVSATVKINKADIAAPTVEGYEGDFDGSAHTITVGTVSGGTLNYSTDNSAWVTTKPTRTDVGTTTVYVKVIGDSNHNNSSTVTATITINQGITYVINNYPVDETNKYINKIITGTTLEQFLENIDLGGGYTVEVDTKTKDGKKLVYTGGKTRIKHNGTLVAEYTNIVIGDTNGDGLTNSADLLRIRYHLLGNNLLTGVYFTAADIDYNEIINSGDLLRVRYHLLGSRLIGE